MIDELFTVLGQVGVVAVFGAIGAVLLRRDFRLGWFIAALALYVLYDGLLTRMFFAIPNYPQESSWNWLGKTMSLAGMLIVASLPMFGFRRVGLTVEQRPNFRTPLIVFLGLIALFVYLAIGDRSGIADFETIAFQWTMPSLDEELFYRGVLLLMMNEAFTRKATILGAPIGYGGLLTSLLFGLAHGFGYAEGSFQFDLMTFALTGIPSLILLWLRERTGSLLLPMLGHSASNGLFTVI
ncbi:MAG TPA: CPBP family intramembrane metalloprotease [Woeseiaceae bacterium]|nr:CPBP family intramembrane metalloprotease [Woeseiaceae bacterium]